MLPTSAQLAAFNPAATSYCPRESLSCLHACPVLLLRTQSFLRGWDESHYHLPTVLSLSAPLAGEEDRFCVHSSFPCQVVPWWWGDGEGGLGLVRPVLASGMKWGWGWGIETGFERRDGQVGV